MNRRDAKTMIEQKTVESKPQQTSSPPSLDEARLRQQALGQKLRQMFDEVVNEPIPPDFLDILRRADQDDDAGSRGE